MVVEDNSIEVVFVFIEQVFGGVIEDVEVLVVGLDGGSVGGSSFVWLVRIVENIDLVGFEIEFFFYFFNVVLIESSIVLGFVVEGDE